MPPERAGKPQPVSLFYVQRRLPLVPESITEARNVIGEIEDQLGSELFEDLSLVLSELVTNVLKHSGLGPEDWVEVRLEAFPELVRGEVRDESPGFEIPPLLTPTLDALGGRGLFLVDRLVGRWGVQTVEDGTCTWFEMDRSAPQG